MPIESPKMKSFATGRSNPMGYMAIIYVVLIVVLIVLGLIAFQLSIKAGTPTTSSFGTVDTTSYQAVFLANGQVYFGKITGVNSSVLVLDDIYYLRVNQQIQPVNGAAATNDSNEQPQVLLVKLGSELHKPQQKMTINRDQILFWENLQTDSPVIKGITEAKKQEADGTNANTNTNTTTTNTNTK